LSYGRIEKSPVTVAERKPKVNRIHSRLPAKKQVLYYTRFFKKIHANCPF
jgi:hypothetical protein